MRKNIKVEYEDILVSSTNLKSDGKSSGDYFIISVGTLSI